MFKQTHGAIRVRTASCQEGALFAKRSVPADIEIISSEHPIGMPLISLQEYTIYLNRGESSFISKEVRRMIKAKIRQDQQRQRAHIPPPPTPGKINYAVYQ